MRDLVKVRTFRWFLADLPDRTRSLTGPKGFVCCCTFRRQHLFLHLVSDWGKRSPGTVSLMNLLFGSLPSCLRGGFSLTRTRSPFSRVGILGEG